MRPICELVDPKDPDRYPDDSRRCMCYQNEGDGGYWTVDIDDDGVAYTSWNKFEEMPF